MSEEADEACETIHVTFERRAHPVADFEDASAYIDYKDDAIMWAWEFTRRAHWYQHLSDMVLIADHCEEGESIPADLQSLYAPILKEYYGGRSCRDDGKPIMDDPPLVSALTTLYLRGMVPAGFASASWRKAGYWQHPEGPPDDMHKPHIRSHQSAGGPWAIDWPGLDAALSLADVAEEIDAMMPMAYFKALGGGTTVGSVSALQSRAHYMREVRGGPDMAQRLAHFAFDLSLPIEWQLKVVRAELAFMQKKATKHGFVDSVNKAEALPGTNGVLMLRCLDADVDRRDPNDSQIMRAFGWNPASDRTRFKRLRKRAETFRDELAPKLCELRT